MTTTTPTQRVTHALWAALLTALVTACQGSGSDGPRTTYEDDHVSLRALPGWQARHEREVLVLVGPESAGLQDTTISIHSVPVEGDWVDPRTPETVIPATAKVLAALPQARLAPVRDAGHPRYRGQVFDVTFVPRGKQQPYQRRHAVLVGKSRVYHIWLTAPDGRLEPTAHLFSDVVASVREEV